MCPLSLEGHLPTHNAEGQPPSKLGGPGSEAEESGCGFLRLALRFFAVPMGLRGGRLGTGIGEVARAADKDPASPRAAGWTTVSRTCNTHTRSQGDPRLWRGWGRRCLPSLREDLRDALCTPGLQVAEGGSPCGHQESCGRVHT